MIRIRINKDSKLVAKIILYNSKSEALMLTRSKDHNKFPGELDLPGGHLHVGEKIKQGLAREVKEETGISIKKVKFYKKKNNKYFFYAKYNNQKITLSKEHTNYSFISKNNLDKNNFFERIAIKVLDKVNKNENKDK